MATWVEDITQALKNLSGQATNNQICNEVQRIRTQLLPKNWEHMVMSLIYNNTADNPNNPGKDLFRWVGRGVWALQDPTETNRVSIYQKNAMKSGGQEIADMQEKSKQISRTEATQEEVSLQEYLPPESIEEITNILQTIKQYRDYSNPDSSSWKEYVDEFFHILGFSTEKKNPRLTVLNVMGANHTPRAIVGFIHPGENFYEIVPGLSWESYLFFAANYYQIVWGILTDGLQLKVVHYQGQEINQPTYWSDIDGVFQNEKIDTFCTIYKMFSYIKGDGGKSIADHGKRQRTMHGRNREDLAERHLLQLEFWRQLLDKAKTKTKLHAKISPRIKNCISVGAGRRGLVFNYVVRMDDAQVELYIDRGEAEWNKSVFNAFLQHKAEIEELFGGPLDWQLLPDKRASRIRYVISGYGLKDEDQWDELQEQLVDVMIRLEKAFWLSITKDIPK